MSIDTDNSLENTDREDQKNNEDPKIIDKNGQSNSRVSIKSSENTRNSEILILRSRKRKLSAETEEEISQNHKKRKIFKIILSDSEDNISSNEDQNEQIITSSTSSRLCESPIRNQYNFFINYPKQPDNNRPHLPSNIEQIGSNVYNPKLHKNNEKEKSGNLKPIFIDGSNIAYAHGNNKRFSVKGLKICIDFFKNRGHEVKAFVPNYRMQKDQTTDPVLLRQLEQQNLVILTPTLTIQNKRKIPYDDWYIIQSAALEDGIIVSRDNYQDIIKANPALRKVIEESRLVPTFVNDTLIFPVDPLGNRKYNFEEFLRY